MFPRALRPILAACACLAALGAWAQPSPPPLPMPGEIGKDVMWIPSEDVVVGRMLDLAGVTPRDLVVDLGSGDGRIVIAAARRGAHALGIEFNPELVAYARARAAQLRVRDLARFTHGDLFRADFSRASVVTLFLLEEKNVKLRPKLLALRPGTRLVSNSFAMGEWKPDRELKVSVAEGCTAYCEAYLWIVPARVGGRWRLAEGTLELEQSFQRVAGTLRAGAAVTAVAGRIEGEAIRLQAGGARYHGRVRGDVIEGAVEAAGAHRAWIAMRASH